MIMQEFFCSEEVPEFKKIIELHYKTVERLSYLNTNTKFHADIENSIILKGIAFMNEFFFKFR